MIAGFAYGTHSADGVDVAYCTGGSGPPLLLLHGFPQTHMMWAQIAPKLAQNFTVICADLRGYGASGKPNGTENYSFRAMGQDQLSLMSALGFTRFHLAGHDRGGRVAHRIALDAPQRITSLTVMDIVPTHHLLDELHQSVAKAYYHWFFLAQPAPFPETLIAADPDYFYQSCLLGWGAAKLEQFPANQLQAYRLAWPQAGQINLSASIFSAPWNAWHWSRLSKANKPVTELLPKHWITSDRFARRPSWSTMRGFSMPTAALYPI